MSTAVKIVTGDFSQSPLASVLQVLHTDRETATLVCRNGDKKRALFFWRGQACDALSSVKGERLIDVLRTMDKIAEEQYQRVLDMEGGHKTPAQLLIELGVLPVREVISYMRLQIIGVVMNLFEESTGIFKLMLGESRDGGFNVRVPVPEMLFSGVRRIRPAERLVGYLGALDRKAMVQPGASLDPNLRLDESEQELVKMLRGKPKYRDLLELPGRSRVETAALLYALELVGYLAAGTGSGAKSTSSLRRARVDDLRRDEKEEARQALPRPDAPALDGAAPAAEAAQVDLAAYTNLEAMSWYEVLNVTSSAGDAEIKAAYFRLAKQYHPDRFFGQEASLVETARRIFEAQSRAYNTLKDPAQRHEYDKALRQGTAAARPDPQHPAGSDEQRRGQVNFRQAQQALEIKDYQAAVDALRRATESDPAEPRYWATLAEIQSRFPRWRTEAVSAIEQALKLRPDSPELSFIQAEVLFRQGDLDGAHRVLSRLVAQDSRTPRYRALLDEVVQKRGSKGKGPDKGGLFGKIFGS
jgi:curved DNA-binding protein CbpA